MEVIRISSILIVLLGSVLSKECYESKNGGHEYKGTESKTKSGYTCQRWDSQSPHKHYKIKSSEFPDANLFEAKNYCRSPTGSGSEEIPWCYTTAINKRWEFCDIPKCDQQKLTEPTPTQAPKTAAPQKKFECYAHAKSHEYKGTESKTKSGYTCQRWDSQSPQKHGKTEASRFPDASLLEAQNYCRSPTGSGSEEIPWCYTTDPNKRWEFCDIPKCAFHKKYGLNYVGCFKDKRKDRDVKGFSVKFRNKLRPVFCIDLCKRRGFEYAALQYGVRCRCGNKYGAHGPVRESECDMTCKGNKRHQICGGFLRNSIYKTAGYTPQIKYKAIKEEDIIKGVEEKLNNLQFNQKNSWIWKDEFRDPSSSMYKDYYRQIKTKLCYKVTTCEILKIQNQESTP